MGLGARPTALSSRSAGDPVLSGDRQWDGEVVDAFFRARDRIDSIHQRGVGDSVWFALNARRDNGLDPDQPTG